MNRFGLALSGGGFRAVLYHLGLVRFLRDAGILPRVTHISAVSGGSIIAAHLVLNWDRYNGSPNEFDAAASELISFVRLDVRNRIVRRFPLCLPLLWPRRLLGLSNRKLTRTGLLEYHYKKYLYGDTSLFELPERPELHMLATNLSEGCLCSFNRNGLLMMHRQPGHAVRIERIHAGLATVPMAVTASSAFPGFFPPVELTGADVGANSGEFGRQSYTDGGVFDNLGVRLFGYLERPLLGGDSSVLRRLPRFSSRRRDIVRGRQVQRGNTVSPARSDHGGCLQPTGLVVTHQRGAAGRGRPPAYQRARAGWKPDSIAVVQARGRQWRRSGNRAADSLGRFASLPVTTRAALRRAETRGPRRGIAPPCQPFWRPRTGGLRSGLAEPAPARSRIPAGHGPSLLPQARQRAGRHPRQRCGKAVRGSGQPPRRRADPDCHTFDRHRHGSGLAARDRDVPGLAQLRLRPDYRGGRAGRRLHGVASGDPAAGGQHPHGLRSLFASGNQQPGATRILCWSQGVPGAPRPVWS